MRFDRLEREQIVGQPLERVFGFFSRAENLEQITPPWLRFRLLGSGPVAMRPGTRIEYRLRLHRVPVRWTTLIEAWEPDRRFIDRQVRGPYRRWRHEHLFSEAEGGTLVRDRIEYAVPLGQLGRLSLPIVRRDLTRIFDYRQAAVKRLLG